MKNIYYIIWADIILTAKKNGNFTDKWKDFNYVLPIFQGMNLGSLTVLIKVIFDIGIPLFFNLNLFSNRILNDFGSGFLSLFLPFYLMNYFLIIRKNRYEKIIDNYKSYNGKFLFNYILISIVVFFSLIFLNVLIK